MEDKPVIGIVGLGFVGQAVFDFYKSENYEIFTYDIAKDCTGKNSLSNADIIFLCLPTPYKNGICDLSALEKTFEWLPKSKIVIIKSTIPPGTTDSLSAKYHGRLLFNPEFLDSSKSSYDFCFPERQIIGTPNTKIAAKDLDDLYDVDIFQHLPKANRNFNIRAKEAECVKYMGNTFFALKNVFANMWHDYCESAGINYETIMEAVGAEPRIGYVHMRAKHKGGRGAGGSCLPKDLGAAIGFMSDNGTDCELLTLVRTKNDKRLKESGKTDFLGMYDL